VLQGAENDLQFPAVRPIASETIKLTHLPREFLARRRIEIIVATSCAAGVAKLPVVVRFLLVQMCVLRLNIHTLAHSPDGTKTLAASLSARLYFIARTKTQICKTSWNNLV
jgi:hypothetical protein